MNNLVKRLSESAQPVIVGGPSPSAKQFINQLTNVGYAFIKFTETSGGTDLGLRIDPVNTKLEEANIDKGTGNVHVEGTLNLNFIPVRCVAEINLESMAGTAQLFPEVAEISS